MPLSPFRYFSLNTRLSTQAPSRCCFPAEIFYTDLLIFYVIFWNFFVDASLPTPLLYCTRFSTQALPRCYFSADFNISYTYLLIFEVIFWSFSLNASLPIPLLHCKHKTFHSSSLLSCHPCSVRGIASFFHYSPWQTLCSRTLKKNKVHRIIGPYLLEPHRSTSSLLASPSSLPTSSSSEQNITRALFFFFVCSFNDFIKLGVPRTLSQEWIRFLGITSWPFIRYGELLGFSVLGVLPLDSLLGRKWVKETCLEKWRTYVTIMWKKS